ncbi:hypothetical protein [Sphingomonas nostoxanthinifaciens]|uniref:hypothetical protein n=1 Tax=Sphingomonas nostoxanthinifaciens TaxID=2872652 RepID=UPI001CC208E4|nr:hypothetical protein [Sphingomonas nostoxanthinifaciens]UAK24885.1 hypothetical protein K8P63_01305 [Sphingomonas nostoxanthinifaciens]
MRGRDRRPEEATMGEDDHMQPATCTTGQHRARRVRLIFTEGTLRSRCRDCGCDLVRTQATRRWYYSGSLGAT